MVVIDDATQAVPPAALVRRRSWLRKAMARPGFWSVVGGGVIMVTFVCAGLFAPLIAPMSPYTQHVDVKLLPPVWSSGGSGHYLLGTDALGRDILSRLVYGARISLFVGVATAVGAATLGVTLGLLGAYRGGWLDYVIQRFLELFQAFPFLVLAILVVAVTGSGVWKVIVVLVLTRWIQFCRVSRAEALSLKTREFVISAHAMGSPGFRTVLRHLLPAVVAPTIVVATFSMATSIISEASLSFLGLGVPPQVPTWGSMLADGRQYMYSDAWLTIPPGAALFIVVVAANVLGDGIRDMTDPRLRV